MTAERTRLGDDVSEVRTTYYYDFEEALQALREAEHLGLGYVLTRRDSWSQPTVSISPFITGRYVSEWALMLLDGPVVDDTDKLSDDSRTLDTARGDAGEMGD